MRRCRQSAGKTPAVGCLQVEQIPSDIGFYLAGFADGEGSFNVSFRPRSDYRQPWKISLCFNISQRDRAILALFQQYLQCGTMRQRADGVWYYEVNTLEEILENVIPFFGRFRFLSAKKQRDFAKFCEIAGIVHRGEHISKEGTIRILEIRREMNDGGNRRYGEAEILSRFKSGESSETVRRTLSTAGMIQSGLRGDTQSG